MCRAVFRPERYDVLEEDGAFSPQTQVSTQAATRRAVHSLISHSFKLTLHYMRQDILMPSLRHQIL